MKEWIHGRGTSAMPEAIGRRARGRGTLGNPMAHWRGTIWSIIANGMGTLWNTMPRLWEIPIPFTI
jgi:hypothetical protein